MKPPPKGRQPEYSISQECFYMTRKSGMTKEQKSRKVMRRVRKQGPQQHWPPHPQWYPLRKAKGKRRGVGNTICQREQLKTLLRCASCVLRKVANLKHSDMMAQRGTWLATFNPHMG